jgi:hypothetical protein
LAAFDLTTEDGNHKKSWNRRLQNARRTFYDISSTAIRKRSGNLGSQGEPGNIGKEMSTVEELEARITALEKKHDDDLRFLVKSFEDDQDNLIRRIDLGRSESSAASAHALDHIDQVDLQLRVAVGAKLQEAVDDLILRSSSVIVAEALHQALSKTVLLMRQPTAAEARAGLPVFAIRTATQADLRK